VTANDDPYVGQPRERPSRKREDPIQVRENPDYEIKIPKPPQREPGEEDTQWIAKRLVSLFHWSVVLLLILGIMGLTLVAIRPDRAAATNEFLRNYLGTAAIFLGQVFGPLLGAILGFYFGRHTRPRLTSGR
jgi:hypothetical protein